MTSRIRIGAMVNGMHHRHPAVTAPKSADLTCSIHLGFDPDESPAAHADKAEPFFEAGVDIVVWSMRGEMDAARLGPFADALA